MRLRPAKTAKQVEVVFGVELGSWVPKEYCFRWEPHGFDATFAKLLWPLGIIITAITHLVFHL